MGKKRGNNNSSNNNQLLSNAARYGDVEFLREKVHSKESKDFFLKRWEESQNILHLATRECKVEFFKEAVKLLPRDTIRELLSAKEVDGYTPLHFAVNVRSVEIVKSVVAFYKEEPQPLPPQYVKPWLLEVTDNNHTPLHLSFPYDGDDGETLRKKEDCALEVVSLDFDAFCNQTMFTGGESLLCHAIRFRFSRLALYILNSSSPYVVSGFKGFTPLHYAPLCSGEVLELLLEKHSDMIDKSSDEDKYSVLHQWAMEDNTFSTDVLKKFPKIRKKLFKNVIHMEDTYGRNALHLAAGNSNNHEIALILIHEYIDVTKEAEMEVEVVIEEADPKEIKAVDDSRCSTTPWRKEDQDGDTPLYCAFEAKNEKLAAHMLTLDPKLLHDLSNYAGESPLYVAVENECDDIVNDIIKERLPPRFKMLCRTDRRTVLHNLHNLKEETGRTLLKKFWWLMNVKDDEGTTALDEAKKNNVPWLVNLLENPYLIEKEPFDWIQACKDKEKEAILAFSKTCPDLRRICRRKKDTPLHHIRLDTYQDYMELLKISSINDIKNLRNSKNQTPLHRALVEEDINLAKALLRDKEVDWQKSAKLLQRLYQQDENWKEMCDHIKLNPTLTTGYIQPGTNLGDMRTTLSVVAALLATITFAAGFTLPGGLNQDTGDAILARRAAFIVFLLADVYAMCTSMLVLLCLIWSMASSIDMSLVLVDRSVFILMQAVYGTMVAFMTGIYLVIARNSLWTAIVIFVMCSFLVLSASIKSVLHILIKLIPAANQGGKDILQEVEEGTALISENKVLENTQVNKSSK